MIPRRPRRQQRSRGLRHPWWLCLVAAVCLLEISSWRSSCSSLLSSSSSFGGCTLHVTAVPVLLPNAHNESSAEYENEGVSPNNATMSMPLQQPKRILASTTSTASFGSILGKAFKKGMGGGIPGAIAGVIQVLALMWLRTIINHQARYGTSFSQATRLLYKEGGIPRFYSGLGFAIFQAPVSRFVATASNDGILSLLSNLSATRHLGPGVTTVFASIFVGLFRILLMPIDTCKTVLQVDAQEGYQHLMKRVRAGHIGVLYAGSIATAVSAFVGHYPWFVCFNFLKQAEWLPVLIPSSLLRNAAIGLISSVVSDAVVNVFRVVKTTKQSMGSKHDMSYKETIQMILAADGWKGLFGRGLTTRIFANALQSILFTVIWRGLAEHWGSGKEDRGSNTPSSVGGRSKVGIRGAETVVVKPAHNQDRDGLIDLPRKTTDTVS